MIDDNSQSSNTTDRYRLLAASHSYGLCYYHKLVSKHPHCTYIPLSPHSKLDEMIMNDNFIKSISPNFDPSSYHCEAIVEGLIMILYWDEEWKVSSNLCPIGSNMLTILNIPSSQLFWDTWKELNYQLPNVSDNCCYTFQLLNTVDRWYYPLNENGLILESVRDFSNFQEIDKYSVAEKYNWKTFQKIFTDKNKSFTLQDIYTQNVLGIHSTILCDQHYNRILIRHPAIEKIVEAQKKSNIQEKELFYINILAYYHDCGILSQYPVNQPEYDIVHKMITEFDTLCDKLDEIYQMKHHVSNAEYREFVVKEHYGINHFLLWMRNKGYNTSKKFFKENYFVIPKLPNAITNWWLKHPNCSVVEERLLPFCFK
eukprot:TRINITY_DN2766_c1_g1_i2.p1 TRINITY_DN2766_c1_g1~~TRINITY_DN2766_c1_g1_i2.p1  ORF type:complete len:370 (-),score=60.24 TRINITY_DN2766_c1_g1_i2:171-1280(-)